MERWSVLSFLLLFLHTKQKTVKKLQKNYGVSIVYIAITCTAQKSSWKQRINLIFTLKACKCKANWKNIAKGIKKENLRLAHY